MATEGGADLRGLIEDVVEDRRRGADSCEIADAILGAIAEAGMVIVDAERFERVAGDAERWRRFAVTGLYPPEGDDFTTVLPGDLDRGAGRG